MSTDESAPAMSGEVVETAYDGPGEWLKVGPAAVRLGISERTAWRRVRAGALRRRGASEGTEVWVPLAGAAPDTTSVAVPAAPDRMTLAVIEELRRQHEAAEARLTRQADDIRALAERAARAEALAESLAVERAQAKLEVDELREALDAERRRPWWRRLLGRE